MIEMHEAIERLIVHEGLRLKPYKCPAGYLTIGVGRNVETNPITEEEKKVVGDWERGITENGAKYLLKNDILKAHKDCKRFVEGYKDLDDERQYALLDMCFNLGIIGLLKFRKMLYAMSIGDYRGAAKECLNSKYAKDVGKRAVRIARTIEKGEFSYD